MFEECGRKALTDQKEKQMSDIRSKDMDQHNRVCAQIDLDAIAYNMEQMKDQIGKEARLIAVIKTDGSRFLSSFHIDPEKHSQVQGSVF